MNSFWVYFWVLNLLFLQLWAHQTKKICYCSFFGIIFQGRNCFWSFRHLFCTGLLWKFYWVVLISTVLFCLPYWNCVLLILIKSFLISDLFGPWVNLFQDLLSRNFLKFPNLPNIFTLFSDREYCFIFY